MPSSAMDSHHIILDVSGRKFRTQKATLQTSEYFRILLTRWSDCSDRQDDDSYFVDADAEVFHHILNFLRRPSNFPLFWTKEIGFDYALYNRLKAEADYFLLHDLRDWIRKRTYLNAVKTIVKVHAFSEDDIRLHPVQEQFEAIAEVQSFLGHFSGQKLCRCPLGIHEQYKNQCERDTRCQDFAKIHGLQFDEKLILVAKTIVFDEAICENKAVL